MPTSEELVLMWRMVRDIEETTHTEMIAEAQKAAEEKDYDRVCEIWEEIFDNDAL